MSLIKSWRLLPTLLLLFYCFYFIKSNFHESEFKINFGLDIQGGSSYLLELSKDDLLANLLEKKIQELLNLSVEASLSDNSLIIESQFTSSLNNRVLENLGLSLIKDDVISSTYEINEQFLNRSLNEFTINAIEVIRQRIDYLGNKEISIQKVGANNILVEIPGLINSTVRDIITQTAKLDFYIESTGVLKTKNLFNETTGERITVSDNPVLSGDLIQDASLQYDQGRPIVSFSFNKIGAQLFGDLTTKNVGKRMAIVLDDALVSAPNIREPILGGSGMISGSFTNQEANNLAITLKSGSLPTSIKIIQEKQIGPTLGEEGVEKGYLGSIVALIAITCFMIIYYRLSGLLTSLTILLCLGCLISSMTMLNSTLTLPGIIGIVLTIGMCVDANVLIYERIRDNIKNNSENPKNEGFNTAFVTILDSNLTTLFAAILLFVFGFGPIRGFSISLIMGIISSLLVTYFVLKMFVDYIPLKYLGLNSKK